MGRVRETAKHHTVVCSTVHRDGADSARYHTVYLLAGDARPLAFEPLLDYFHHQGQGKSMAWQKEVAYSTGLFLDFLISRDQLTASEAKPEPVASFKAFANALYRGTIGADGRDALSLYWEPKSAERASKLLQNVTRFSDWLSERMGAQMLNPWRESTHAERIASLRRLDARKPHELLGYLGSAETRAQASSQARSVSVPAKITKSAPKEPKIFPEDRMAELLSKGFALPGSGPNDLLHRRIALHNAMIAVLMHGGGLRESEAFHIYTADVGVDPTNPNSATVRLYHPEQGLSPADFTDPITGRRIVSSREAYLRQKFGLAPRNQQTGRFSAGWKDLFLMDAKEKYALVHWFPTYWGEVFLNLFKSYIFHCRNRAAHHPYLFVSAKTGYAGDPYTIDSFRQAHAIACRRIGLEPSKDNGTTPHGHRHAYGHALARARVSEVIIQRAMHHKSVHSQRVYTAPTQSEIFDALAAAQSQQLASPERAVNPYPPAAQELLHSLSSSLSFK